MWNTQFRSEMMMRDKKGRFTAGSRIGKEFWFRKGQHYQNPKIFWDKKFLYKQYIEQKKSGARIASENNTTTNNIMYWLHKHKIKTRTSSEIRKTIKYVGLSGAANPMFGKYGKLASNWKGGHSPERQSMYARTMWKEIRKLVLIRDNYTCQICNIKSKLIIHHVLPWSRYPNFRFTESNLTTVCSPCHKKIHGKWGR